MARRLSGIEAGKEFANFQVVLWCNFMSQKTLWCRASLSLSSVSSLSGRVGSSQRGTSRCARERRSNVRKLNHWRNSAPRQLSSATQAAQWLHFAIVDTCHLFPRRRLPYCCCATHKGDKDSLSRLHSMPACLFQFLPFCHFRKERKRVQNWQEASVTYVFQPDNNGSSKTNIELRRIGKYLVLEKRKARSPLIVHQKALLDFYFSLLLDNAHQWRIVRRRTDQVPLAKPCHVSLCDGSCPRYWGWPSDLPTI